MIWEAFDKFDQTGAANYVKFVQRTVVMELQDDIADTLAATMMASFHSIYT